MKFASPEILWALLALAIPIIVHLFNFRRFKKVAFSNVRFLKEVQQETKSRSRLKHLLILSSRLLALTFIILAFAEPYIPLEDQTSTQGKRLISVYLDNSFSMEAENEEGPLLEVARNKAMKMVESYAATDKFQLLTNDFEGRHQRFVSQVDMLDLLDEVHLSPVTRTLDEVVSRQQDLLVREDDGSEKVAYIFSDLQKTSSQLSGFVPDSNLTIRFLPDLAVRSANIYIDSVWFRTPVRLLNQPEVLNIRIKHTASETVENIPLRLSINGTQKAIGSFNIVPGEATDTALTFTHTSPGFKQVKLSLDDYPVTFDDEFFLAYEVAGQVNILQIKGKENTPNVAKVFGNDPYYNLSTVSESQINYAALATYQLVVLDQLQKLSSGLVLELQKFIENGGHVLMIPHENADLTSYNELILAVEGAPFTGKNAIHTKVDFINLEHYLYQGVFDRLPENLDLPKVNSYFTSQRLSRSREEVLLSLQNGTPFLSAFPFGSGKLYVTHVSLRPDQSNFAQHAIFVPTLLRIAENSQPQTKLYYTIGEDEVVNLRQTSLGSEDVFRIKSSSATGEFIPENRRVGGQLELFLHNRIKSAGLYQLSKGDEPISYLGFNYSREESNMLAYSIKNWQAKLNAAGWTNASIIESNIDSISKVVDDLDQGRQLWHLFLILALAMVIIEILLIKLL